MTYNVKATFCYWNNFANFYLQLKKHGFQHIDALDPSQGMLDKAKEKNLYERYICDFITDKHLDIEDSKTNH